MKFTAAQLKKWQADPAHFVETQLIDPVTSKPFVLLPAERDFIAHAFKIILRLADCSTRSKFSRAHVKAGRRDSLPS